MTNAGSRCSTRGLRLAHSLPGVLLLWVGGHAMAACVTSPGARLQATAGSVCSAAGSYGSSGIPAGQSALGASTGGGVNAASLVSMSLSQNGINGVHATDAGSQIDLQGGLTLVRPGASSGIRGLRAANGATVNVNGPLSMTLSNGSSNYGIYAESANTRVVLNGSVGVAIGAGGAFAPGIRATTGATIEANGAVAVTTGGDMRSDAITSDNGSTVRLNGRLNLGVTGTQAATLKISSTATITYAGVADLRNAGLNGSGIRAVTGGVATATASSTTSIQSSGINGIGISVRDAGSQVNLAGPANIRVTGATQANTPAGTQESYAAGLLVTGGGALNATSSLAIATTDASSYGAALLADSPSISATGTGSIAAAGSALGFFTGAGQSASFGGFSIASASGDLVRVDAATGATLTLKNSSATASSTGNLLHAVNGSSLAFAADNSTLTGNVVTDATSTVSMRLLNGSALTGSIDPVALAIDGTSHWTMTGNSSLSSLALAGRIDFQPPGSGFVPQTLTVNGNWVGQGGVVALRTALGDSASSTDRIVIDGGAVSGSTTLQVRNAGGLGALTTGDGIMLVSAINGATTTAQTTKSGFSLAGGHVDAGAYEYRLYSANASGDGENWYLRSTTPAVASPPAPATSDAAGVAGTPPTPVPLVATYRAEVPLFSALPSQLRQADLAMLGNLHRRTGDGAAVQGQHAAWGRLVHADVDLRQQGTVTPSSEGRMRGFQTGMDLFAPADSAWRAGVYVGQLEGRLGVQGFARGVQGAVGSNDLRSRYLGAYATWKGESERYADAVLQAGSHRYGVEAMGNPANAGRGRSLVASLEIGQAFALSPGWPGWRIEPQAQVVHQTLDLDDTVIGGARVSQQTGGGWLGRLGVRMRGEIATAAGLLQPYARLNFYSAGAGTDVAQFVNAAAVTRIAAATGYRGVELAGGFTLALSEIVDVYGELGRLHATGGGLRARSSLQGSGGMRARW
ncbi:type V secretory pathway adhesin AidA [Variovorax boronicumulans]|uniref:autotransporter family protein n=1 Tax=Variovorax boronicumulans TaxID=436515 RepID=UPI00247557F4|nr:autotransporter domain-containing protein [Variovorax boronicumulans]MDH6170805.1 type V secretory pathway adhesin AidA [Variovorax boronicumulans]